MSHLQDLSLAAQAAGVADGSIDPAELLAATFERIDERNEPLNAFIDVSREESERMLASAPDGPLRGVPIAIKDMFTLPWRGPRDGTENEHMPPGESAMYRRLRDAGAVIAGVTNMHWNGAGSTGAQSVYGPVGSALNAEHCGGGSSGGSGAAVGASMVAGAVGTDGGGSVRMPAAYNGIFGLKHTFGLPTEGFTHGYLSLGEAGPMCRSAADARLLGEVMSARPLPRGDGSSLTVGIPPFFWEDLDPEVERGCRALLERSGWETREVDIAGAEHALIALMLTISLEGLPSAHEDAPPDLVAEALFKYLLLLPARAMPRVARIRSLLRREAARLFREVDLLVWPTVPSPPPRIDNPTVELPSGPHPADEVNVRLNGFGNLTGLPAASAPAGTNEAGLPYGLMLQAAWGEDAKVLDAGEHLESVG